MFSRRFIGKAAAITAALTIVSSTAMADDWSTAMDRHYSAAEETRFLPKAGAQWGFSLSAMMNDLEWRKRTAAALRNQRRPSVTTQTQRYRQLVEEAEPRRLSPF